MLWNDQAPAPELLSLGSRDQELQLLGPGATAAEAGAPWSLRPATGEAPAMRSPRPATREKACAATET